MVNLPQRKCVRLKNYDYSIGGAYFITICTQNRLPLLGEIRNHQMVLSNIGEIAQREMCRAAELRDYAIIANYVIMPNHVHMIIVIDDGIVGTRRAVSAAAERFGKPTKQSVPTIIRAYKAAVTKCMRDMSGHGTPCPYKLWQSRFHDHIIRNEMEYQKIWEYIETNPQKWEDDCFCEYGESTFENG